MFTVKKRLIMVSLVLLLVSLIGCGNKNEDSFFKDITENDIENVLVSSVSKNYASTLTDEELAVLIRLLNNIGANDIKEYNGPNIKEGPINIIISMKTKETLNMSLIEDNLIFWEADKGYQVHQPEVSKFIYELMAWIDISI